MPFFSSLKERQLGLPDALPIRFIDFKDKSETSLLLATRTSLYELDTKKLTLKKCITLPHIDDVTRAGDSVFLKTPSSLISFNIRKESTSTIPFSSSLRLTKGMDDGTLLVLTTSGDFYHLTSSPSSTTPLASHVSSFTLSPEGKRVALISNYVSDRDALSLFYLAPYLDDTKKEEGQLVKIPLKESLIKTLWIPPLSQSLALLTSHNDLMFTELDSRLPLNSAPIDHDVKKIDFFDNYIFILKKNGALETFGVK